MQCELVKPMYQLDQKDFLFLHHLRQNARMGLTQLSRKTGVPISTIHHRLKLYASSHLIKRYTALVDFSRLGYGIRTFMLITAKKQHKDPLKAFLIACPVVNKLMKINHGYDFFIDVAFKTMQDVDQFRELLCQEHGARDVKLHYIIEELKYEGFFLDRPYP
jgi:Lrp/AsnC family transcriptional regulator, regulator for asnA, asnC and gidA